jgi:hypothetical protein
VFGLGTALAVLNAKNAPLAVTAGAAIGSAGLPTGREIASPVVFVAIATLGDRKGWAAQHSVGPTDQAVTPQRTCPLAAGTGPAFFTVRGSGFLPMLNACALRAVRPGPTRSRLPQQDRRTHG